jgi:ClpP class serine protease
VGEDGRLQLGEPAVETGLVDIHAAVDAATGEMLRELILDRNRDYQPTRKLQK